MPLGAGSNWPVAVDSDALLGPTSGIVAGVTHLGDTGTNQGDQLGITKNLINSVVKVENVAQCGNLWCVTNGTFVQPAIGATVAVTVYGVPYGTAPFQIGMTVMVQPGIAGGLIGGVYLVTAIASNTSITLLNKAVQGINTAAGNTVPTASVIMFAGFAPFMTDSVALYDRTWDNSETVMVTALTQPNADWTSTNVGTAGVAIDNTAGDSTALSTPSLWQIIAGAGAPPNVANVAAKNIFIPSLTPVDMTFSVSIPVLSTTGTQEYTFGVGLCSSTAGSVGNPFMGIGYKLNGGNTAWNVFAGATMGANITTTGVTIVVNTLYHLRMTLNQGWTSLNVWVNHAGPTTVSTNLQTGTMFPCAIFSKTVGTGAEAINWARTKLRLFLPR
jgi:hypothetical protein